MILLDHGVLIFSDRSRNLNPSIPTLEWNENMLLHELGFVSSRRSKPFKETGATLPQFTCPPCR